MLIWRAYRPLDRERQSLDLAALKAEMRLAEAGGETRAEDFEFLKFLREPELDAVPIEPCGPMSLIGCDRRETQFADMPRHLGIVMMREHRDVTEHVMESVGRLEIIELRGSANKCADWKDACAQHRKEDVFCHEPGNAHGPPAGARLKDRVQAFNV